MANPDTCFKESTGPVGCLKAMNVADGPTTANNGSEIYHSLVVILLSALMFIQLQFYSAINAIEHSCHKSEFRLHLEILTRSNRIFSLRQYEGIRLIEINNKTQLP